MALAIGVNVATLSLLYRFYITPLPYKGGSRILNVEMTSHRTTAEEVSIPIWMHIQSGARALADSGIYQEQGYNLVRNGQINRVNGIEATASVFSTLGVKPLIGRAFGPESSEPGAKPVVVLSYRLWRTLYSSDKSTLGQTLQMNGKLFTVIGVMPRNFNFPTAESLLWTPIIITPYLKNVYQFDAIFYHMIGRLAPGQSVDTFLSQANVALTNEINKFPLANTAADFQKMDLRIAAQSWRASRLGDLGEAVTLVPFAAALLLILAWFNLANLFFARALARRGQLMVRRALGATAWTLTRAALRENMVISLVGAGLGVVLGWSLIKLFSANSIAVPWSSIPGISWPTLVGIAVGLASLSAGVFTLVGLGVLRSGNLVTVLSEGAGSVSQGPLVRHVGRGLLVAQIALACALGGTGLALSRSLLHLSAANVGFEPNHLVTFKLSFSEAQYSFGEMAVELNGLSRAASHLPGVEAASISSDIPFASEPVPYGVFPHPPNPTIDAGAINTGVGVDYLKTLGIPLLAGRNFTTSDAQSKLGVAIINTLAAKQFFGSENVVGRTFSFGSQTGYNNTPGMVYRVIGVVPTVDESTIGREPEFGTTYLLRDQVLRLVPSNWDWRTWCLVVRSSISVTALVTEVKSAASKVVPNIPLYDIKTMNARIGAAMAVGRILTVLLAVFGFGALLLSGIGLYAVQAYAVSQRTRELAIRAALGADRQKLVGLIVRETALLLAIGLVVGLAGFAAISVAFASYFYGIGTVDPLSMAIIAAVLAITALGAGWLPAHRAGQVVPDKELRRG